MQLFGRYRAKHTEEPFQNPRPSGRLGRIARRGLFALLVLVLLALLGWRLGFLDATPNALRSALETKPAVIGGNIGTVTDFQLSVNLPALFLNDVTFQKGLTSSQIATLAGGLVTNNQDGDFGTGSVFAANIPPAIVSSLTAGSGVGISLANPQIPSITNTGVLSLQGATGAVSLSAGSGISISGLTIASTLSAPAASNSFATIAVSGQSTLSAGSPTDTLTFVAGNNVSLTTDTGNKSLTIDLSAAASQWTTNGTSIYYNSGNVGIGTLTPGQPLDVESTNFPARFGRWSPVRNAGATLQIRRSHGAAVGINGLVADQDFVGGFVFQADDGTGTFTNAARILAIIDGTPGVGDMPGRLHFETTPDGSDTAVGRLEITSSGNVGIGAGAPLAELHVTRPLSFGANGKALAIFDQIENQDIFTASASGTTRFVIQNSGNVGIGTTAPGAQLDLSTDSARKLTTTTWTTGSDARIKTNVQTIGNALEIIGQVRPVKYHYTPEYLAAHPSIVDTDYYSFIAQEYQQVFPNSVTEIDGLLYLNSSNMIPYAIAGVKALDQKLSLQEARTNLLLSGVDSAGVALASLKALTLRVDGLSAGQTGRGDDPAVGELEAKYDGLSDRVQALEELKEGVLSASTSALVSAPLEELGLADKDATVSGDLMVLGRATLNELGVTGTINAGLLTIQGLDGAIDTLAGPLKLQSAGLGDVEFVGGKLTIDKAGNLHTSGQVSAKRVTTEKLDIDTADQSAAAAGKGAIPAGEDRITIETSQVTSSSLIFVTATAETDVPVVVDQALPGRSFTVEMVRVHPHPVTFNWWIVN